MRIRQPIFIVGVGRSGSTAFHQVFCGHPRVAWLSRLAARYPSNPWRSRLLLHGLDFPLVDQYVLRAFDPSEAYEFWDHYFRGFSKPYRDLTAADVTERARSLLPEAFSAILTSKRERLLAKITGWPRIGFLQGVFPDAKFIHVVRDGRAVANSLLNVDWWFGWLGPSNWIWGELTIEQREEWDRHGQSFVALAGIQWKLLMKAMENAKRGLDGSSLLEIRYEDFCTDPEECFRQVTDFCCLEYSRGFRQHVLRSRVKNENDKWRQDLTAEQQTVLHSVLGSELQRYGYV